MSLVGRDVEVERLTALLHGHRLVTVVGPGGVGKTSLARQVSATVESDFDRGASLVDLTRVDRSESVEELIAGQVGVPDFRSLLDSPDDRSFLLVVDNCEHVLDAAADATSAILESARAATILATSRSPLEIAGEVVLPLGPLEVPPDEAPNPEVSSVRMFQQRASDLGVSAGAPEIVAEICRRLDGVPLAIEIAVARLRTSTAVEVLADLVERPSALSRRRFRGQPAHRSVAEMVEWSTDLLPSASRSSFEALAVFAGPFTLEMAHAVAGPTEADPSYLGRTRELLDELVDASLLVVDTSGDATWYRMLRPVRAVALERLRRAGDVETRTGRAVEYAVQSATQLVAASAGGWSNELLSALLANYDNMIASLRWALEHDEQSDRALLLLAVLWGVVHQAHSTEVGNVGQLVIERWPDPRLPLWCDAAATVATSRVLDGDYEGAIELAESALPHAERGVFAPSSLRRVLAHAHRGLGDADRAADLFVEAAAAARSAGAHGFAMEFTAQHAMLIASAGATDRALELIDEVVAESTDRNALVNQSWALAVRGAILSFDDPGAAIPALQTSAADARALGYPAGETFSLGALASAHLAVDDIAAAASTVIELLTCLVERSSLTHLRFALVDAAEVLERCGDDRWADLAATADASPVTSVVIVRDDSLFERARVSGKVLDRREAYLVARAAVGQLLDDRVETPAPGRSPVETTAVNSLVREGDTWRWVFGGRTIVVKATKGMADLAALLTQPGREVSALDLTGSPVVASAGDEVIDAQARREYEERIRDLHAEIEEAEDHHDLERADRAQQEMDHLVTTLSAAVGLGGRTRRTGGDLERARSAVTQRIRSTISRITQHDEPLGAHLRVSVLTGSFCSYAPAEPTEWTVMADSGPVS